MLKIGSNHDSMAFNQRYYPDRQLSPHDDDLSDAESFSSRSSMSLSSSSTCTSSSEAEEEEVTQRNTLRNMRNCRVIPPSPPITSQSTGKRKNLRPRFQDDLLSPIPKTPGISINDEIYKLTTEPVIAVSDIKVHSDESDETSL